MACGAVASTDGLLVRERMFGLGDAFRYLSCADCGSLQIAGVPSDLARYYPAEYYSFEAGPERAGWLKRRARRLRDRHALFGSGGLLGRWLERRFPYPELRAIGGVPGLHLGSRIVDVGCGAGTLLRALRAHGFVNVLGIDPFVASDVTYEDGVRVLRRSAHELEGEWDLVMFHHSLEHVPDPAAVLRHVEAHLAAGGQILVRIPIVPSAAFERYREHWVGLDAPRHLFVPSLEGIRRMADGAGLRVARVVHDSTELQFWASEQYQRDIPLVSRASYRTNPDAFAARQMAAWKKAARALNRQRRGDQAAIVLSRP